MTQEDTRDRIARAKAAARLGRIGSLSGALGVVMLALGVVGLVTGRTVPGVVAVVLALILFTILIVGIRVNAQVRKDPAVQRRTSRLRRAGYRDAYPRDAVRDDEHAVGS